MKVRRIVIQSCFLNLTTFVLKHLQRKHLYFQAGSGNSLLEPEDLFNSSYVPNNPSLVLDTAFWKNSDNESGETLVHLQPIIVEQTQHSSEETYFLNQEEGKYEY